MLALIGGYPYVARWATAMSSKRAPARASAPQIEQIARLIPIPQQEPLVREDLPQLQHGDRRNRLAFEVWIPKVERKRCRRQAGPLMADDVDEQFTITPQGARPRDRGPEAVVTPACDVEAHVEPHLFCRTADRAFGLAPKVQQIAFADEVEVFADPEIGPVDPGEGGTTSEDESPGVTGQLRQQMLEHVVELDVPLVDPEDRRSALEVAARDHVVTASMSRSGSALISSSQRLFRSTTSPPPGTSTV